MAKKPLKFKSKASYLKWVKYGQATGVFKKTPGVQKILIKGKKYKSYRGMASPSAQKDWKGSYSSNEGISAIIPYKGHLVDVLDELNRGICSGFSYSGAENIEELRELAIFRNVSPASRLESSTHILGLDGVIG